jgi:hypothetical protein
MMHPGTGCGSKTKRTVSIARIAGDKPDKKKKVAIRKLPKAYNFRWNVDNYTRLLRSSLTIECQSNILKDSFRNNVRVYRPTKIESPVLKKDVLMLAKQAMDAIKVSI